MDDGVVRVPGLGLISGYGVLPPAPGEPGSHLISLRAAGIS